MKKRSLLRMYLFFGLVLAAANFAHPFTPKLLTERGLPDYMFGLAFACMALGGFLFAPFWGKISDNFGRAPMMMVCGVGYAVGQIMFCFSTTVWQVMLARFFAGLFCNAFGVCGMAYVADATDEENRGKYMSIYAAVMSVSSCIGYFIGGFLGDVSVTVGFTTQAVCSVLFGLGFFLFVADYDNRPHHRLTAKSFNPFSALLEVRHFLTTSLIVFFAMIFFLNFASCCFENAFNYFIRDELNFPSSYNGIFKAVVGLLGLLANFTLNIWLVRHTNMRVTICLQALTNGVVSLAAAVVAGSAGLFVVLSVGNLVLNNICLPMQQFLATADDTGASNGALAGLYNSVRSMGNMAGSLFAGFIYTCGVRLPFWFSAFGFGVAVLLGAVNYLQYRKRAYNV